MNMKEKTMTILVAGASGATGSLLVEQLLSKGHHVRAIVRNPDKLPTSMQKREGLTIMQASILDIAQEEMSRYVDGCDAIASCLGHNLTVKGIFGHPRRLVTDAVSKLCEAVQSNAPKEHVKFLLMNTTGNRNRDLNEQISIAQKCVIGLLRIMLPPHVDNENAADYLRTEIGKKHPSIEWAAVRPDGLIDSEKVTEYDVYPSPIRSAIFDPGKTSRINVGHFMAELICDEMLWNKWKGRMPVIYNK
jgi:hypothetical protein